MQMQIILKELSFDEGLVMMHEHSISGKATFQGESITMNRFWFKSDLKCRHCGSEVDRFVIRIAPHVSMKNPDAPMSLFFSPMIGHKIVNIDHIVPTALGGIDHEDNYAVACAACNESKGHTLSEQDQQFLLDNLQVLNVSRFVDNYKMKIAALKKLRAKKKFARKEERALIRSITPFRVLMATLQRGGLSLSKLLTPEHA